MNQRPGTRKQETQLWMGFGKKRIRRASRKERGDESETIEETGGFLEICPKGELKRDFLVFVGLEANGT